VLPSYHDEEMPPPPPIPDKQVLGVSAGQGRDEAFGFLARVHRRVIDALVSDVVLRQQVQDRLHAPPFLSNCHP